MSEVNSRKRRFGTPHFFTHKFKITRTSQTKNIHQIQLQDHFRTKSNLYILQCDCTGHKHTGLNNKKEPCIIVTEPICIKCEHPTKLLLSYKSLMFHGDEISVKKLTKCCIHTHAPPCKKCINCKINIPCIISEPFECRASTEVVCHLNKDVFTTDETANNIMIHEHIYNIKSPVFYFCFKHKHRHNSLPEIDCIIREFACCEDAIPVTDFNEGFVITANDGTKPVEYTIFDPSIWRDQSVNHFMSFLRAIIANQDVIADRFKHFINSRFVLSNMSKHISGKGSFIRTAVTGYENPGVYQTTVISGKIKYYEVFLPQVLYDLLESQGFDLDYVMVKRDPSILPTCMYVCVARRNSDPSIMVIVISDQIAKGMHQDQDGDRNACYFLRKILNGYDSSNSYWYKVAKMELAKAYKNKRTLHANPRYLLSETSLLKIGLNPERFMKIPFFAKTFEKGPEFMNQAAAGIFSDEYDEFQTALMEDNINEIPTYITTDDILVKTKELHNIVSSKAKGSRKHVEMLLENIEKKISLSDNKREMAELYQKYIDSSQNLSRDGRKQFAAIYGTTDIVCFFRDIFMNKQHLACFEDFASAGTFIYNEASMELYYQMLLECEIFQNE